MKKSLVIGRTKMNVKTVSKKQQRRMRATLRICHAFKLPMAEFLAGRVPQSLVPRGTGELGLRPGRPGPRAVTEVWVGRQIEDLRPERIVNPPSLAHVSREVGFAARTLREHFPVVCREISSAHRRWCREQLAARLEERRQAFRVAIRDSRAVHKNPTRGQAMKLHPKPGLRSAAARREFDQLLLDMK